MKTPIIRHGSAQGFDLGCRSQGGCLHHRSLEYLTCVEAVMARRGDHRVAALPPHLRLPRDQSLWRDLGAESTRVHGTPHGYRRGCRDSMSCPNSGTVSPTCAEARAAYVAMWKARRGGTAHGTAAGYHAGCRGDGCPVTPTCSVARRAARRASEHGRGVEPLVTVDSDLVAHAARRLLRPGTSVRSAARQLGIGRSTLARLLAPAQPTVALTARVMRRLGTVDHPSAARASAASRPPCLTSTEESP